MSRSDYDNGPEQRTGGAERPGLKTVVGEWGRAVVMRNRDRATIIAEREQASSGSGWEWGEQHRRAEGQPIDHVGAQRRRWGSGCGGGIGKRCQKMGHSRARAGRVGSEAERDRWVRRTPKSKSGGCSGGGDWEAVMMAKASRRLLKKKKDADAKESRERVEREQVK